MTTVRVWFSKTGEASYISLLDLQRVFQRALKRSGLPVWYTQGFNPHIYMTFAAPLALGHESLAECVDFKSEADGYDWSAAAQTLSECLPKGVDVLRIGPAQSDTADIALARYEIRYTEEDADRAACAYAIFAALEAAPVEKKGKRSVRTVDLKAYVDVEGARRTREGFCLSVFLPAGGELTISPSLVTNYLAEHCGLAGALPSVLRTALYTKKKEVFV